MAVQYMSDLHLERTKYQYAVVRAAPILVLAGDVGRFCDYDLYCGFLAQTCDQFDLVLLVAGNHEFYGSSRDEGLEAAERLVNEPAMNAKLRFLNRHSMDLPNANATVLGCTLHSHIAADYTALTNDFEYVKAWTVKAHNAEHEKDLRWLQNSLRTLQQARPERAVIVVTHYAPMFERVSHPKNEGNALSQCFSSTALKDVRQCVGLQAVSYWLYGHTHWNVRFKVGTTTVLSNHLWSDDKNLSWWQKKRLYRPFDSAAVIHF